MMLHSINTRKRMQIRVTIKIIFSIFCRYIFRFDETWNNVFNRFSCLFTWFYIGIWYDELMNFFLLEKSLFSSLWLLQRKILIFMFTLHIFRFSVANVNKLCRLSLILHICHIYHLYIHFTLLHIYRFILAIISN